VLFSSLLFVFWVGESSEAKAQQATKVPRIGFLSAGSASSTSARAEPFRLGLRALGYVEGKNVLIEYRGAEGKTDSFLILRLSWSISELT
jgi:hypothetical protein